jgi:hypothetical protein
MRISKSILLRKWSRNAFDVEDNAYETLVLDYNRKLDVFVSEVPLLNLMWKKKTLHHTQKMQ